MKKSRFKNPRAIVVIICVTLFLVITLWDVTVNGIYEPVVINADHFNAGAGKGSLVTRSGLLVLSVLALLVWIPWPFNWKVIILKLGSALLLGYFLVYIYGWSATGLERFSPGYDEQTYQEIVARFSEGEKITAEQISDLLGAPLVSGEQDNTGPGIDVWLYSYMPTCGFGWEKRVLCFDENKRMEGHFSHSEP